MRTFNQYLKEQMQDEEFAKEYEKIQCEMDDNIIDERVTLNDRNQKIIDAIIEKEKKLCPGALALIGVYGSFLTGDVHPLSDLDLLILINDDRGWGLSAGFILDDIGVGYDIYCTTWDALKEDAEYNHPQIAKLLDSNIVYCADEKYLAELEGLRSKANAEFSKPLDSAGFSKAQKSLDDAKIHFANALLADDMPAKRSEACWVLYSIENAYAMLNRTYYKLGGRRCFKELNKMQKRPENLTALIENVAAAGSEAELDGSLTALMRETSKCFEKEKKAFESPKEEPTPDSLRGTYEEMFSNWHGKVLLAAETDDKHLAFMTMGSLAAMIADIAGDINIDTDPLEVFAKYDPKDLSKTAAGYDEILAKYLKEYEKTGLKPVHYKDVNDFIKNYL